MCYLQLALARWEVSLVLLMAFMLMGAINAGFSMLDTGVKNYVYKENENYAYNAGLSFAFGGLRKIADTRLATSLQLKSLPITYSNVSNFSFKAPVTGDITGSIISNLPPVMLRDKKPE